jgi:hypothetical protein
MTLRSGLRATLDQSALGYKTVGELHSQLDTHETQLTNLEVVPATAVTATSDGLTTGLIPATAVHITVTSSSANNIITLPTPVVGKRIRGWVGTNGCEVRAVGTSVKVNDVIVSATNEGAIPADTMVEFTCVTSTAWLLHATTKLGAVLTAIIPDAV